jgi:hypothetical protein
MRVYVKVTPECAIARNINPGMHGVEIDATDLSDSQRDVLASISRPHPQFDGITLYEPDLTQSGEACSVSTILRCEPTAEGVRAALDQIFERMETAKAAHAEALKEQEASHRRNYRDGLGPRPEFATDADDRALYERALEAMGDEGRMHYYIHNPRALPQAYRHALQEEAARRARKAIDAFIASADSDELDFEEVLELVRVAGGYRRKDINSASEAAMAEEERKAQELEARRHETLTRALEAHGDAQLLRAWNDGVLAQRSAIDVLCRQVAEALGALEDLPVFAVDIDDIDTPCIDTLPAEAIPAYYTAQAQREKLAALDWVSDVKEPRFFRDSGSELCQLCNADTAYLYSYSVDCGGVRVPIQVILHHEGKAPRKLAVRRKS